MPCPWCKGDGCEEGLHVHSLGDCDDGELVLRRCPLALVKPTFVQVCAVLYRAVEHNILPVNGGFLEQTAIFCELVEVFDAELSAGRKKVSDIQAARAEANRRSAASRR